jgi:hypothetical protein
VDEESIPDILKQMYSFAEVSREGILSFFDQIRQRYHGILRSDIEEFLSRDSSEICKDKACPVSINHLASS